MIACVPLQNFQLAIQVNMPLLRRFAWIFLAAALAVTGAAATMAPASVRVRPQTRSALTLDSVLHELDTEAKDFHSLTADIERTKVTVVVNVKSTETGEIWVHGDKMRMEVKTPDPRTILRAGDTIYIYNPGLQRVEEYNLGKHREMVDQFLLLGFGSSGHELRKGFLITLLGEPVLDHHKTALLELTPKSEQVRNQISKIHLWLDESSWEPLQQKFFETGTDDYFIVRYSNITRNASIPDSRFKPHWPKGTQRVRPSA